MSHSDDNLRSFWNRWIEEYLEKHKPDGPSLRRGQEAIAIIDSLSLDRPRILEVGCANGWLAAQLAQFGQVTGVDIADEAIERARVKIPTVEFFAGDFTTMDDLKSQFDIVIALETIGNVPNHELFVSHLVAAMKPGGHLILSCQNKFVFERREDLPTPPPGQIRNWLDRSHLKRLLKRHFQIEKSFTILPAGHLGILRFLNSYRLEDLAQRAGLDRWFTRIREQLGLGQSILIHARLR
ncbi:MAG: class I SAM-dependent methyltransferase [Candidatus Zixiibacteriota bacterium]